MRITADDLCTLDLLWFGIDSYGRVFSCFSGVNGNVPEFVCRSFEETDLLGDYFIEQAKEIGEAKFIIPWKDNSLCQDCEIYSKKGLYCFDGGVNSDRYVIISRPTKPLMLDDLPENIKAIMKDHVVDTDAATAEYFKVKHAY